jgi:hypothetical protein
VILNPPRDALVRLLADARTIVVLGASEHDWKAGSYVPEYLHSQGIRVLPVNPNLAGATLWGERVRSHLREVTLADAPDGVDLVNVFRRPELLPAHVPEILAMTPRPRAVWFQLGIRHDGAARELLDAGVVVVQDRCTLADHRAWDIPAVR